jgi:DUF1009 family protein
MEKIGLIAGNRKFPLLFSEAARKKGFYVVAVAIKGDTSPRLKSTVDKIHWIGLHQFQQMFGIFKQEGITKVIMAGQISPRRLFSKEIQKDKELSTLLRQIKDKKADTIFGAVAKRLEQEGLSLIDSTTFVEHLLPKKGTLTRCEPDFSIWEDIYFGLQQAKAIAYLDIGQTVAVKEQVVVAVEAFEGTDNLIRRAGRIVKSGMTVVKVSKPNQDMRFDIPVVGLNTVRNLVGARAKCLAIEADKTLFIDKEDAVALADKKRLAIVAV